ncbi:hypothetical protein C8T65DRAFT_629051 [Cerioporus squamosus]|nr:hypothetical protein C8T65DRAFT_629051 [Cerioporus squamosus]
MSPGSSSRKKPVCQKCGHLMAGHKRPYGIPVCPRDETAPAEYLPAGDDDDRAPTPTETRPTKPRLSIPDFTFDPSSSGYWHRANPNWVDRDPPQPNPFQEIPERGASWVPTESASGSPASPARPQRRAFPDRPRHSEVINVDAHEDGEEDEEELAETQSTEDYDYVPDNTSDTQSNVSTSSSRTIMKRLSRGLSLVLGHSTPLASLYSSPRDEVTAITSAAQGEGLYTRIVHLDQRVKTEPLTPTRTTPTRDHSWWVAVGRDRDAVDAIVDAQTPRKPVRRGNTIVLDPAGSRVASVEAGEPYDFERGLSAELNERIGTFPEDPRKVRNTFIDTLVAGAVGGLVVFYCLSSL